jgi:hypothetical protein
MIETMAKIQKISLNDLWKSAAINNQVFHSELLSNLPPTARRYLEHAIAPTTKLASAVRDLQKNSTPGILDAGG